MIGTVSWLAGAVAIVGLLFRIRLWRGSPLQPGARHLVAFTVAIGLSMVLTPLTQGLHITTPSCRLMPLLSAELKLAAECFLVLTVLAVRPGGRNRFRMRWQVVGSVLVIVAAAVLYRAAGVTPVGSMLTVEDGGRAALTGYDVLFTVHSLWCVGLFTVMIHRSVRQLGPGLLRTGLWLIFAAGACGLLWSARSVFPLISAFRTGRQNGGANLYSASVGLATLVLIICGMTLTAWGDRLAAPVHRMRARRNHRRIGPLWSALYAVRPEIALEPPTTGSRLGSLTMNPEFALYRRVIEIRDGQLALRAHLHAGVPEWAAEACRVARLDQRRTAATVEAAVFAAALEALAAGRRYPYPGTDGHTPPTIAPDLRTESSRLALVAEAFTHSPVVASIRRRVRTELDLHPVDAPGS
ncbi:MAB_1171c family putative transporter [Streptomyces nojiriensis]|uniref:MAB_1171c family putative transporter n=1 Tax=Streptomyces nojiriensis TaxID=66374 RepID=UPI0035DA66E0